MGVRKPAYAYVSGKNTDDKVADLLEGAVKLGTELVDNKVYVETSPNHDVLHGILDTMSLQGSVRETQLAPRRTLFVHSWDDIRDPDILLKIQYANIAVVMYQTFVKRTDAPTCRRREMFGNHPIVNHALKNFTKIMNMNAAYKPSREGRETETSHNDKIKNEARRNAEKLVGEFFRISKEHGTIIQTKICEIATKEGFRAPKGGSVQSGAFRKYLIQAEMTDEWDEWFAAFTAKPKER